MLRRSRKYISLEAGIALASIGGILISITYLIILQINLFEFRGLVEGGISLTSYRIKFLGKDIDISSLDSVQLYSLILYIQALLQIVFGIYSLYTLKFGGADKSVLIQMQLGASISNLMVSTLPSGLYRLLNTQAKMLEINIANPTSAGYLYVGTTKLIEGNLNNLLVNPIPILSIAIVYLALTTYVYYVYIYQITGDGGNRLHQTSRHKY